MFFQSLRNRLSVSNPIVRRVNTRQPRYRLAIERLEDRLAPATITFSNDLGGAWGDPQNWDLKRLPTLGDTAMIDKPGITVTYSENSGTTLVTNLTLNGRN